MPRKTFPSRYLQALALIALSTGALFLLRNVLTTPLIALLYLLPVGIVAAQGGLGPGMLAAAMSFLAFNYFFVEPYLTFAVHQTGDVFILLVFLFVAGAITQLVGRAQAGMTAATAREHEATELYELSTALVGLQNEEAIARAVAEHVRRMFQADRVELSTHSGTRVQVPALAGEPSIPPADASAGLHTGRGELGELRLWRQAGNLGPADRRLLQTLASQGALALERARLAQAETRGRVLEESDRLKTALLSSVSHELRTPLATIKAAATSLRSGEVGWDSTARAELISVIDDEADHLNRLVGNLLDMSRIEAGALKPQRQWNQLSEIVAGVVARMQTQSERHRIETEVPDDLPLVPVDYVQLEQVLTNLIANGLKYAPQDTRIRIQAQTQDNGSLGVEVSNQGPPVPDEHLDRIFDKFYRVTAADRVTGTGLGLSICRGIVEAHGGKIWAQNDPGGFSFHFTLPLTWDGTWSPTPPLESEVA